ncbi:ATP-binding cassette domain-containing protein [Gleimia hominis]|uniref:ATP-binding cassette domain-containing protein n=1 Tax=Gleimia hominis TaxID=595468 RepID=UPI000C7F88E0|nr:ATP-binding cassette domain-containing protein [Gleimia hominis]WIK63910.1 ATP-binding cassette domain-containing protein [Gleimia hominis]
MALFSLNNVSFSYPGGTRVIDGIDQAFEAGKVYAIVGASGAGKTTLLGLLAGLDTPTLGTVSFNGEDVAKRGYAHHRKRNVSLVFQDYNLIEYMTPEENLKLVDRHADLGLLEELGLSAQQAKRNVLKLSGGQQQRVAVARALAADTPVILADEPTGNLDAQTGMAILDILCAAAHEQNKCVIVVTHSKEVTRRADIVLQLNRGKLKRK